MFSEELVAEIQYHLIEPGGGNPFASGLWTLAEVLAQLSHTQARFLTDTGLVLQRATLPVVPQTPRVTVPEDLVILRRMAWHGADATWRAVGRGDTWEADHLRATWPSSPGSPPQLYTTGSAPNRQLELVPAPMDAGEAELLYVATGQVFPSVPLGVLIDEFDLLSLLRGSWIPFDLTRLASLELREPGFVGTPIAVPDEFAPTLKWGTIAALLSKPGRGFDPIRAGYADSRYQEGVASTLLLLSSWSAS